MSKTKIVVLQMKELVYTGIFVGLGILLVILLIVMFYPFHKDESAQEADSSGIEANAYIPGVYNSQLQLGDTSLNLEVAVDENQIKSVSLVNLDESITTMYPLVQPSLEYIEEELIAGTAIDDIAVNEKSKYTQAMLVDGIKNALEKAKPKTEEQ